jgi:hypothetical protein
MVSNDELILQNTKDIAKLISVQDRQSKDLAKLINHMDKNMTNREEIKRVHSRIDSVEDLIKNINSQGCTKNKDNVASLVNNRKWFITLILSAVLMALLGLVLDKS